MIPSAAEGKTEKQGEMNYANTHSNTGKTKFMEINSTSINLGRYRKKKERKRGIGNDFFLML
jgi:hypothetical protein